MPLSPKLLRKSRSAYRRHYHRKRSSHVSIMAQKVLGGAIAIFLSRPMIGCNLVVKICIDANLRIRKGS
jgi:hypothetical protein